MEFDWQSFFSTHNVTLPSYKLEQINNQTVTLTDSVMSILPNYSLISVDGEDRNQFLQGQTSVNMPLLRPQQHKLGVACTPKGRMYSQFLILNDGERYLLRMRTSLVNHTLTVLQKYAVFFKAALRSTTDYLCLGLSGAESKDFLQRLWPNITIPESGENIQIETLGYLVALTLHPITSQRYELWLEKSKLPELWPQLVHYFTPTAPSHWELLNILAVTPEFHSQSIEAFLPQQLNQPSLGAVSFKKGCYTGQEIITRMQTLSEQKSLCYPLSYQGEASIEIGSKIYDQQGKAVGEVVQWSPLRNPTTLAILAIVRIASVETGRLYLDTEQKHPLKIHPLPYTVDQKAELQQ